jgi:thiol-disulfide isomerase/thioredoxin
MPRPAVFRDLTFSAALERSKSETKLLLVDATAAWCQPCKVMDETTWSNEAVATKLREIAVPIQLDVDQEAETAKALRIKAMPTVVLFRDGVEIARITGTRTPDALLRWVDDAIAGRAVPDEDAEEEGLAEEVSKRFQKLTALIAAGNFDEASEEGLWSWNAMAKLGPIMDPIKHSVLATTLKRVAAAHPATATKLRALRDALPTPGTSTEGLRRTKDWVALNSALGEEEKSLAWFEGMVDQLAGSEELSQMARFTIVPMLVERDRWRDVGRAYPDPMGAIRKGIAIRARMNAAPGPEAHKAMMRESATKAFREEAGLIVRGLRAAGRTAEAEEVIAAAQEADPSPEMKAALAESSG